ncbi:GNAT family N-acetyltransferase [Sphingomonas sp. MG17]|uniref:GNAT family N-acetyltransferase n=1 Tax=Sphingomonas tagetis TaxID=2949092 RepID=A0A9X2KPZ7_9SPHN|nr:GNAT family N-acetyltransferase [Sphingomonas tagetis]MCP3731203.1 GNAT family N-acetyltransferase [Sphingomonas tagetis]
MGIAVRTLEPGQIAEQLDDLARLRIAVFREWPYLYDGDAGYEAAYLTAFAHAPHAVLAAAFDGDAIVGMATASPMTAQAPEIREPVAAARFDISRCFYFGESVLLPGYRGHGIGHAFFDHREAGARAADAETALFCSVVRTADHPLRPADARSHHHFWTKRGYAEVPGLTCRLDWREIGEAAESPHALQFWSRAL